MWTAALAPVAPKLCVNAICASFTVRSPAAPVNCSNTSTTCPIPVAPIGCPFDFNPPDGFIGIRPSLLVAPSLAACAPVPFLKKPKSSTSITSAIVKQSCTSAKSISSGLRPAILYACFAAATVLGIVVISALPWTAAGEAPLPEPITFIYGLPDLLANSSVHKITADAPSEKGQQSKTFNGEATTGEFITSSTVIFFLMCAFGLRSPLSWFLTATYAKSSSVALCVVRYARAIDAKSPGNDAPLPPS